MFKAILNWCQRNDPNGTWMDAKLSFTTLKYVYDTLSAWQVDCPESKDIERLKAEIRYIAINLDYDYEDDYSEYEQNMHCDNYGVCSGPSCRNYSNCN